MDHEAKEAALRIFVPRLLKVRLKSSSFRKSSAVSPTFIARSVRRQTSFRGRFRGLFREEEEITKSRKKADFELTHGCVFLSLCDAYQTHIQGVKSRKDSQLEALFPAFKSVSASCGARGDDNSLVSAFRKVYEEQTRSRVWMDEKELKSLGEELRYYLSNKDSEYYKEKGGMPLQFGSADEEIGFVFLMEALRFGSRYDRVLEDKTRSKRGVRDTIQFGLMAMFISGKPPHLADHLINNSTNHEISVNFDFPIHESQALDFAKLGGVYKDVDGPLAPLATAIGKSMTEMGVLLRSRQMNHLGELVVKLYLQLKDKTATEFAKVIAKTLPTTFGDESNGLPFLSKAQHCVYSLATRFPDRFADLKGLDDLHAIADAELAFALRKLGVLRVAQDLQEKIDSETHVKLSSGGKEELALRVGALLAVHEMATKSINRVVASQWICDKAINIVHPLFRAHLCETMAY